MYLKPPLAVAGVAVGQITLVADFVFGDELGAQFALGIGLLRVGVDARVRRSPAHRPHGLFGAQEFFGMAMAIQTPLHREGVNLHRERRLIDSAVARFAAHAFVDVQRVVEINEVGQVVNAVPLDGLARNVTRANGREFGRIAPNLRVARHTGVRVGHARRSRFLDRGVAVTAVNAVVPIVMLMRKLHRLNHGFVDLITIGHVDRVARADEGWHTQNATDDGHLGEGVAGWMKQLSHESKSLSGDGKQGQKIETL